MIKKIIKIFLLPLDLWLFFITYLPGPFGYALRYIFWKLRLKFLGKKVKIDTGVFFQNPSYIVINDNCWIDKNVIIMAGKDESSREKIILENDDYKGKKGEVIIGKNIHIGTRCIVSGIDSGIYISDDCTLSADCKLYGFTHHYKSKKNPNNINICFGSMVSSDRQCLIVGAIFIGFNTGIALNSIILPGVSIGENSFVSVNSVVFNIKHPSNSVISGYPSQVIGKRFESV